MVEAGCAGLQCGEGPHRGVCVGHCCRRPVQDSTRGLECRLRGGQVALLERDRAIAQQVSSDARVVWLQDARVQLRQPRLHCACIRSEQPTLPWSIAVQTQKFWMDQVQLSHLTLDIQEAVCTAD
jgi:hypothetical protein